MMDMVLEDCKNNLDAAFGQREKYTPMERDLAANEGEESDTDNEIDLECYK